VASAPSLDVTKRQERNPI
jgi:hypothetical protein